MKWGGILHVEVWHMHATGEKKAKDFFGSGLAMFEIRVTEKLQFNVAENRATKVDMERHVEWLKGLFSGWIGGRMLSDPKSREYLLAENNEIFESLDQLKREKSSVELELEKAQADILELRGNLIAERRVNTEHQAEVDKLKKLVVQKNQKLSEASTEKVQLTEVNTTAAKRLFLWRLAAFALVLLIMMLLWLQFAF
ncbi:hypothetical protein C8244_01835 [Paracidovorax avenae]|nr:hypothetical protein C8244_01835 [Paracidovorax avenae]